MAVSQNGYSVLDSDEVEEYPIAGTNGITLSLRPGAAGYVLAHFATRFNNEVERLGVSSTWGYNKRQIEGSSRWSNHASATAVDLNATQHPYGSRGTFSSTELSKLRDVLRDYDGAIRWGGDYTYTKDEMHFEIDKPYTEVYNLAAALRREKVVYMRRLKPGKRNLDVLLVKRALKREGMFDGKMNKYFGVGMRKAYSRWQESLGYTGRGANGIPGKESLEALGFTVK